MTTPPPSANTLDLRPLMFETSWACWATPT